MSYVVNIDEEYLRRVAEKDLRLKKCYLRFLKRNKLLNIHDSILEVGNPIDKTLVTLDKRIKDYLILSFKIENPEKYSNCFNGVLSKNKVLSSNLEVIDFDIDKYKTLLAFRLTNEVRHAALSKLFNNVLIGTAYEWRTDLYNLDGGEYRRFAEELSEYHGVPFEFIKGKDFEAKATCHLIRRK